MKICRVFLFFSTALAITVALLIVLGCVLATVLMGGNPVFYFSIAFLVFVALVTALCLLIEANFQRCAERAE